jgi:hypothetical protein
MDTFDYTVTKFVNIPDGKFCNWSNTSAVKNSEVWMFIYQYSFVE